MNGLDRESGLLLSCRHFIGGSSAPPPLSLSHHHACIGSKFMKFLWALICLHWFFFSHTLFFVTPQIFEILISGVSEFLGDEIASSETAGNKMKKLAPRRRAPARSVHRKPFFFPLFLTSLVFFLSNQAWNSKHCNSTKLVSHQLFFPLLAVHLSFFSTLTLKIAFNWTIWFRQY